MTVMIGMFDPRLLHSFGGNASVLTRRCSDRMARQVVAVVVVVVVVVAILVDPFTEPSGRQSERSPRKLHDTVMGYADHRCFAVAHPTRLKRLQSTDANPHEPPTNRREDDSRL
jgi:hypothetical protein